MKKILFITLASVFVFSCGIKGPPLPPIDETTIQKQRAELVASESAKKSSADATKAKKKK